MPPKLRNRAKPENSNQPTPFQQWRSGRSHHIRQNPQMSDAKNFSCNFEERWSIETISQALWNTSGILVGHGIKTGFCSDKAILQRYVITLFENTLFCYEIIEDFSSALRYFYDKGNRFYQPHYYLYFSAGSKFQVEALPV